MVRSGGGSDCAPSSAFWLSTPRSGAPSSSSSTCSKRVNRASARQLQSVPQSSPRASAKDLPAVLPSQLLLSTAVLETPTRYLASVCLTVNTRQRVSLHSSRNAQFRSEGSL